MMRMSKELPEPFRTWQRDRRRRPSWQRIAAALLGFIWAAVSRRVCSRKKKGKTPHWRITRVEKGNGGRSQSWILEMLFETISNPEGQAPRWACWLVDVLRGFFSMTATLSHCYWVFFFSFKIWKHLHPLPWWATAKRAPNMNKTEK